jgi:hypothetical protein
MHITNCRICGNKQFKKLFSLGKQVPANNLLDKPGKAKTYPLTLVQCLHCTLLQLDYVVPKEEMYDNYLYIPSVSKTHLQHFHDLAKGLYEHLSLKPDNFVVDIGGSDGSLLKIFEEQGLNVLNVEPAKNIESKVMKEEAYFTTRTAKRILKMFGRAKLVTATNSFAHIDDLHSYLKALDIILDDDGVFFAQFPDARNLLAENQFDTIYHEHLSYFTYEPLHHLFASSPFELYKIDNSTIHGGSMRIYVRRRKPLIKDFISSVASIRTELRGYLEKVKQDGTKVVGFGAAAKGMVLLQYCGLDSKYIDYIADGTPYKQSKFTPNGIPIYSESMLDDRYPGTIILILAWNFKEEIMDKLKGRGYTFVIPIPKVTICE